jgi:multicomponent Na+:H+ antiporter subunit D
LNVGFIAEHSPALLIAAPLFAAFLLPVVSRLGMGPPWVVLCMAATALVGFTLAWQVFETGTVVYVFGAAQSDLSIPPDSGGIPIRIIFTVDAMSALMTILASVVAVAVTLYSLASDAAHTALDSFYSLLFLLVAGAYGMICTGDLFNLFVFLEITSLAGAALVAFRMERGVAAEAGLKYMLVSTLGALFFLLGVGILFGQYNALNIAQVGERLAESGLGPLDKVALCLFLASLAMKCGAVPMHFWTPDAYTAAPSSVTAMLIVSSQASLYALIRLTFSLYGLTVNYTVIGWLLIVLSLLTMVVGVLMAIPQRDLKRMIAYCCVSQTGYMMLGVGVGLAVLGNGPLLDQYGRMALSGGIFQIFNGVVYEGLLFLSAGAIIYRVGTRNIDDLGGLGLSMKTTMFFFIIGALAIIGMPPLSGFASKIMIYESVFRFSPFLAIVALVVGVLTLAPFVKIFHAVFMGPKRVNMPEIREVPPAMRAGMTILAVLVVAFGLFPSVVVDWMVDPAAEALIHQGSYLAAVLGGN